MQEQWIAYREQDYVLTSDVWYTKVIFHGKEYHRAWASGKAAMAYIRLMESSRNVTGTLIYQ